MTEPVTGTRFLFILGIHNSKRKEKGKNMTKRISGNKTTTKKDLQERKKFRATVI